MDRNVRKSVVVERHASGVMGKRVRRLFTHVLTVVSFCIMASRSVSASGDRKVLEEYTVWPKDDASRLSEDYPWPSCVKTTGSQCPGLIDYLERFCTREDKQGCQKRNESVSKRHVLLNLLPGQHKMDLWKVFQLDYYLSEFNDLHTRSPFLDAGYFWYCSDSLTMRGSKVSETVVSITHRRHSQEEQDNSTDVGDCGIKTTFHLKDDLWSAFAFRGGASVRFQDIGFHTARNATPLTKQVKYWYGDHLIEEERESSHAQQTVIFAWDIVELEMIGCRFEDLTPKQGALTALYSQEMTTVSINLTKCDFHSSVTGGIRAPSPAKAVPFVLIQSTEHLTTQARSSAPSSLKMAVIVISLCTFYSQCKEPKWNRRS